MANTSTFSAEFLQATGPFSLVKVTLNVDDDGADPITSQSNTVNLSDLDISGPIISMMNFFDITDAGNNADTAYVLDSIDHNAGQFTFTASGTDVNSSVAEVYMLMLPVVRQDGDSLDQDHVSG